MSNNDIFEIYLFVSCISFTLYLIYKFFDCLFKICRSHNAKEENIEKTMKSFEKKINNFDKSLNFIYQRILSEKELNNKQIDDSIKKNKNLIFYYTSQH